MSIQLLLVSLTLVLHVWVVTIQADDSLQIWTSNYLLANAEQKLEPCSVGKFPRAWGASRPSAQGAFQLPGTAAVQAMIYAHQHPVDCSTAKFLVYQHPWHSGLGAMVDMLADALAWAMAENRVLLIDYPTSWTKGERNGKHKTYCHGGALSLDECYFEPVSSCSLKDVYGPDVVSAWTKNMDEGALNEARKKLHGDRIYFSAVTGKTEYGQIPPQAAAHAGSILKGVKVGGIKSELFWWRAQGTAYIFRPNARTLRVIQDLKQRFFRDDTVEPGTISVHVRRGNKGGEMRFVSDKSYHDYTRALQSRSGAVLQHAVFISTEDPTALQSFKDNVNFTDWDVKYTTVPRNNHNGQAPYASAPTVEALRAFINLDLLLECDGWVGTLGSMWTVLSERLRQTVRCKADKPYADGHGTLAGLGSVR